MLANREIELTNKIVLISCVSKKRSYKSKTKDFYISPLFEKSLAYAHKLKPDAIFILSAKYGVPRRMVSSMEVASLPSLTARRL